MHSLCEKQNAININATIAPDSQATTKCSYLQDSLSCVFAFCSCSRGDHWQLTRVFGGKKELGRVKGNDTCRYSKQYHTYLATDLLEDYFDTYFKKHRIHVWYLWYIYTTLHLVHVLMVKWYFTCNYVCFKTLWCTWFRWDGNTRIFHH